MFKNSGKKIMVLSKIFFWVGVIASIVFAIVFGWKRHLHYDSFDGYSQYYNIFLPQIFFPLLIGGPFFSYISSLILHAFGELVHNSKTLVEKGNNDPAKVNEE